MTEISCSNLHLHIWPQRTDKLDIAGLLLFSLGNNIIENAIVPLDQWNNAFTKVCTLQDAAADLGRLVCLPKTHIFRHTCSNFGDAQFTILSSTLQLANNRAMVIQMLHHLSVNRFLFVTCRACSKFLLINGHVFQVFFLLFNTITDFQNTTLRHHTSSIESQSISRTCLE